MWVKCNGLVRQIAEMVDFQALPVVTCQIHPSIHPSIHVPGKEKGRQEKAREGCTILAQKPHNTQPTLRNTNNLNLSIVTNHPFLRVQHVLKHALNMFLPISVSGHFVPARDSEWRIHGRGTREGHPCSVSNWFLGFVVPQ